MVGRPLDGAAERWLWCDTAWNRWLRYGISERVLYQATETSRSLGRGLAGAQSR